jgi:hypothetical protein
VCWDQGAVAGSEDCLDDKGEHDLIANVFDFVDKKRNDIASNDARHITRNLRDSDLNRFVGVHIESCLRCQYRDGLPDYAGDREDDHLYCEFFKHCKEMVRQICGFF